MRLALTMVLVVGCGDSDPGAPDAAVGERWDTISDNDQPEPQFAPDGVWTGEEVLVFGGFYSEGFGPEPTIVRPPGGRYDPVADTWDPISDDGRPELSKWVFWTGEEMLVFTDGEEGGLYDPATDSWRPMSTDGAPEKRRDADAVWAGTALIYWGGEITEITFPTGSTFDVGEGHRYDPATDTWSLISTTGEPPPRNGHSMVWTGTEVIVFDGYLYATGDIPDVVGGGRYNPATDTWAPMAEPPLFPHAKGPISATWTGTEVLYWGGVSTTGELTPILLAYDPAADTWRTAATPPEMLASYEMKPLWSGRWYIVWGGTTDYYGDSGDAFPPELALYDPEADAWTMGIPQYAVRGAHAAVWADDVAVYWGGAATSLARHGLRYYPPD